MMDDGSVLMADIAKQVCKRFFLKLYELWFSLRCKHSLKPGIESLLRRS